MPLPTRKSNETHDQFIRRSMEDPVMVREYPDAKQRRAVCEGQARVKTEALLSLISEPGAITIEAAAEDGQTADGRAKLPRFSMVAYTGGPMRIAGWWYPVVLDLAGLSIPSQHWPIRFGHEMQSDVGHTDAVEIEGGNCERDGQ